jgi:glycosyltransferase involved in cell wall biosynthesis
LFRLNWIKNILIERNHLDEFKYIKNIKNLIIKILIKLLYKNANKVIGVSKKLSKDLSIYTNAQVRTIYDPAYDKELKFVSKKKIFKRNLKKKIILNIARLEEQKDHLTLLKGFKESLKKIKSTLIIIGYGSKEKEINYFIKENKLTNDVIVMKNIHNPYPFLKSADLFILTSLYEGFGIVLVEAAAHRIPIISTNCNSGPSEILLNGKGGDLIKIKDHKTLSKKIIENLSKKNLKKINIAYKNIKNYSTEVIINQYDKLFKKI